MKLFEGLDNLDNPAKCWALSDHMIVYFILLPIGFFLVVFFFPIFIAYICFISWSDKEES